MSRFVRARGTAAVVGAATLLALLGTTLTVPADAAPTGDPATCPAAYPLASVETGQIGQGLTVVTGSEPQPFQVEILGVIPDGIGAGRDLIMIKVSDLPGSDVISQGGGIWAGMSGSPVYLDGRLLGAVSYGFTLAPSVIGGLTPAADMYDVLAHPNRKATAAGQVKLSAEARRSLAAKAGTSAPRGSLRPITTPLAVSGISAPRLDRLQRDADKAGWNVSVHSAGRANAQVGAPTSRPEPGGNFGAALSFGDVTAAGVGTTTAVCGDQAVAFGHPLEFAGASGYAATDADSLAIIKDDTVGSFKQANLTTGFGTVTQDRLAGIGADLTKGPDLASIKTIVRNLDSTKVRVGTTDVTTQSLIPGLAPYAVFANQDTVFDEIGDGTATSSWTISGTRAGGRAFVLRRDNRFASRDDISFEPAFDVAFALDELVNNDYEDLTIESVSFASKMATTYQELHISKVEVSVDGGRYTTPSRLVVNPGAKLKMRVSLQPFRSTTTTTRTIAVTVPRNAKGQVGLLTATGGTDAAEGGSDDTECLLDPSSCESSEPGSLTALALSIRDAPRNDTVIGQLAFSSARAGGTQTVVRPMTKTVSGEAAIPVFVRR